MEAQSAARPIGIQSGAVSFLDEGTDNVLAALRDMADINMLFLATFTYGRGIGGRQPRGTPLPDHGKQEYDDNYHGGHLPTPHPQYYKNTSLVPEKAPRHPGHDRISHALPRPHARRMQGICLVQDGLR